MSIKEEVYGKSGYWIGKLFADDEMMALRSIISASFLNNIFQSYNGNDYMDIVVRQNLLFYGMPKYHYVSKYFDHSSLFTRHNRLINQVDADDINNRSVALSELRSAFGYCEITNEVERRKPEIVWRIVRPLQRTDVGPLHADRWFWKINDWAIPEGADIIKIWTLVYSGDPNEGLAVWPSSHLKKWNYSVEERHGIKKPVFDEEPSGLIGETILPGESIVFSSDLLHGGLVPVSDECRISVEFTIFVPKDERWPIKTATVSTFGTA
ncbi:MAG: hypothetical protein KGJ90_00380 [Patescibacteria group bacterium]|nr:hypothetical protein [Patescibacteria group bacterium]